MANSVVMCTFLYMTNEETKSYRISEHQYNQFKWNPRKPTNTSYKIVYISILVIIQHPF